MVTLRLLFAMTRCSLLLLALFVASPVVAQTPTTSWHLVEETRYGLDKPDALIGPGPVVVAPNGSVFVGQRASTEVVVYKPDGSFDRAIGRKGSGPGEFQSISTLGIVGDSLWVADANLQRLTFFSLTGRYLVSHRIDVKTRSPFAGAAVEGVFLDGSMVGEAMSNASPELALRAPLLRYTRAGVVRDTLRWLSHKNAVGLMPMRGGFRVHMLYKEPFGDAPLRSVATNGTGLVVVDRTAATTSPATFTVTRYGPNGARLYEKPLRYSPKPLTRKTFDSTVAELTTALTQPPKNAGAPPPPFEPDWAKFKSQLYRPRYYPPVGSVVTAADGAAWLRVDDATNRAMFWVLDATGTATALVALPKGLTLHYATDTHVWAFGTQDDAPFLARFRIVKPQRVSLSF